ncbi:MAG: hypothetical protein PV347_02745 [Rickettsiaceae bacterium]|nr:hypothetical protein [Rickettsiaceae bacterium]MDD9337923.1 hypothetical protein [Rickettsiaceae bacterium]
MKSPTWRSHEVISAFVRRPLGDLSTTSQDCHVAASCSGFSQ